MSQKLNLILKQLKDSKKVNIINENQKQMSIITNIKQKLQKREQIILQKLYINKDPLQRNELLGYIEENKDIIIKLDEMINHLMKINKYCKNKKIVGGISYIKMSSINDDIEMMPHLASYYEGGNILDSAKKGWSWIKENPLKASTYALGAIGLANILTNAHELDIM